MKNTFLDIRNYGFFRVATVSPKVFLADPEENATEHIKWVKKVYKKGAQLIVFPELSLSGYSCQDLFLSQALQEKVLLALENLLSETKTIKAVLVVGAPIRIDDRLFNTAVVLHKGKILAIVPKTYLPDYREFRETRWFATSEHITNKEVVVLGQTVPLGTDVLVSSRSVPELSLAFDICEDIWMPIPPSTVAAVNGATVLVNLSGSNITLTKDEYRRDLVSMSSAKNIAAQIYSSAGFGESTTDSAWDGHGIIADRGSIIAETKRFEANGSYCIGDIDLITLVEDRLRMSSFRDNRKALNKEFRRIVFEGELGIEDEAFEKFERNISDKPFVPKDAALRSKRCEEVFMIQATSLMRRLMTLPEDKRKVTIGISGGLDSTQALLVASKTMDLMKLPRSNIIGLTMPGFGTTDRTYQNAVKLIKEIGATFKEISIKDISRKIFESIDHDELVHDTTYENTQAWSRKYLELATASQEGGLVLGTGDLSELWLGWCTMYGDHASHYGVNSSIPKTLISHLVRYVAEVEFAHEPKVQSVLFDILDTPISPELLPAKKGKIVQKTENIVGPYELHDFFGYYLVRFGMSPKKIARMALSAFEGRYTLEEIKKWLDTFLRRFFASQYKRSVLPDGPKVGSVGPSPRDEWRMPSDILTTSAWMNELNQI